MSLTQDNHTQQILYMYSISQYISDIVIFLILIIGIDIGPKNPISVEPYLKSVTMC